MKVLSDEEIQQMLEHKKYTIKEALSPDQQKEIDAYNFLFRELKKEPVGGLSYSFSAKVVAKIEAKKSLRSDVKVYVFAAIFLILSITGTYFLSKYVEHPFNSRFINMILPYKWILIFVSVILVLIQYLDQILIKRFKITDQF